MTPAMAAEIEAQQKPHKYGVEPDKSKRTYEGELYDSVAEARYARSLDAQLDAGEISSWRRSPTYWLIVGDSWHRLSYTADFQVWRPDRSWFLVDVKGVQTEAFRIKVRLMRHFLPDVDLAIWRSKARGLEWVSGPHWLEIRRAKAKRPRKRA
jgi:hypothetical protein